DNPSPPPPPRSGEGENDNGDSPLQRGAEQDHAFFLLLPLSASGRGWGGGVGGRGGNRPRPEVRPVRHFVHETETTLPNVRIAGVSSPESLVRVGTERPGSCSRCRPGSSVRIRLFPRPRG